MAALIDRLFRALGCVRGLVGGSRPWLYVGLTAGAVRVLRRIVTEPSHRRTGPSWSPVSTSR